MFPTAPGPNIVSVHVRLCVYVCATSLQARMNLFVCFNSVLILTKKYNNCTYGKNKTSNNILDGLYVYLYGTSTITSITVMTGQYISKFIRSSQDLVVGGKGGRYSLQFSQT